MPQMKQCWIDLWTFSQVTTVDLSAWCFLCLCYNCVTLKADVWWITCCLLCWSYKMLMKVTNRTDLQQFGRKKLFTEYNPWWFYHIIFGILCISVSLLLAKINMTWSHFILLLHTISLFFYCPFFLYFMFAYVGKKLYFTLH